MIQSKAFDWNKNLSKWVLIFMACGLYASAFFLFGKTKGECFWKFFLKSVGFNLFICFDGCNCVISFVVLKFG